MIHRHEAGKQAARKPIGGKPDESGILARSDKQLKQERLDKLTEAIAATSPPWARLKPWEVERILEGGAVIRKQAKLPFAEGGSNE